MNLVFSFKKLCIFIKVLGVFVEECGFVELEQTDIL